MAQTPDFTVPYNDLTKYVPLNLRNDAVTGLIENLFNRQMTHDESIPLYGYVGRKPAAPDDRTGRVPQPSVERDINTIIPVLNFTLGAERYSFTVQDLIKKATAIGVPADGLRWLYTQANNYLPPINLDKFANYFNYYWVAKALPSSPTLSWNPELLPEYYTISKAKPEDTNKANVVSTAGARPVVLTGTGFTNHVFKVQFDTPTSFTVSSTAPLGEYFASTSLPADSTKNNGQFVTSNKYIYTLGSVIGEELSYEESFSFTVTNGSSVKTLVTFSILRDRLFDSSGQPIGYSSFDAGDAFDIHVEIMSYNYKVVFNGAYGIKGKISKVESLKTYQSLSGVQLKEGQRVLVDGNGAENGIYIVSAQDWVRAVDYTGALIKEGAKIWDASTGYLYTSTAQNTWLKSSTVLQNNTNDWQEGNYWVHYDELSALDLTRASVVQAVRPIIEYSSSLQLNAFVLNGIPSTSGTPIIQAKSEFNQLPMFDLFRYDGTPANKVSSVFYYVEDLAAPLDLGLQKRVKTSISDSADYTFNHGLVDDEGDLLFYKTDGILKSIWHGGYNEVTIVDQAFSSLKPADKGTLAVLSAAAGTQQQIWTLQAISETQFKIAGSKTALPLNKETVTVGELYENNDLSLMITAGSVPFAAGLLGPVGSDTFTFRIANLETSRYVSLNGDDEHQDVYDGEAVGGGAYLIPRSFVYNPYNESRDEVLEGPLYSHFRGILQNQLPGTTPDYAFGGSIKSFSEQHTLLASLLMQKDLTPISMIDFAQTKYEGALNAVQDIYKRSILQHFSTFGVVDYDGTPEQDLKLEELLASILETRASDYDVKTILYDSTAAVLGFPITLPQLGIVEPVQPSISYNGDLRRTVLIHHDGHSSALVEDDLDFRRALFNNSADVEVLRSDGTTTPAIGSFTSVPPVSPYRGELWLKPQADGTSAVYAFDVQSDYIMPASPITGSTWFVRGSNVLNIWDGIQWVPQASELGQWRAVDLSDTLNRLVLLVETKLYNGINPRARKVQFGPLLQDSRFKTELQRELFSFAALNGLSPLGTDFVQSDAFTWNYSSASLTNFPALSTSSVPARWQNVLKAHHTAVGAIPTSKPHLEPWKLLGITDASEINTFKSTWASSAEALTFSGSVRVTKTSAGLTALSGLPIIDGIQLRAGDRILLQNEPSAINNGTYIVSAGVWSRSALSLTAGSYVTVSEGDEYSGTTWSLVSDVPAINVDPLQFAQVRPWSNGMWSFISSSVSGLKLSVDTIRDTLLPPYVSSTVLQSSNALTTSIPSGTGASYAFNEGSPVETVFLNTVGFGYSLARALFRHDPLHFLGFCWGFNWVQVDGMLYDGYDLNIPGHKRFRLHGDPVREVLRDESKIISTTITGSCTIVYDAYEVQGEDRYQSFTVLDTNGAVLGYLREGVLGTISGLGSILIQDEGKPFHIGDHFMIQNGVPSFMPTSTYQYLGFGQVFTNALRASSIDTGAGYATSAFNGWDVNMGYRASGLVATDDLNIRSDFDTLSASSYDLVFKKNQHSKDMWVQGLRITVSNFGTSGQIGQPLSSYVPKDGALAPRYDGSDWVFNIEGYNPRYSNIQYYELDTTGEFQTFNVLDRSVTDTVWNHFTSPLRTTSTYLPLSITGIQNVVTFLFGYAQYLEASGWAFNQNPVQNIDAETGRARTWQLEVEKFIDRCYRGLNLNQGHIVNPFMDQIWVRQEAGMLSEFKDSSLFDITGNPGVYDIAGVKMVKDDLQVTRGNEISKIGASAPMYSVHAQLDEYEHLFIFKYFVEGSLQNGLLYHPFSGSRVVTYKFNGRRQASQTFRPEFGGHYLVGNEVRQNIQASTDNITKFYDPNHSFENELTTRHALSILGFSEKQYFADLDISKKSQFNFWRGLIQSKGTNMSVDAYLNNNRFEEAKIDEYWAYKVGTYGDSRQRTYPELKLTVDDTVQQFTQLQFDAPFTLVNGVSVIDGLPNFAQISRFDESRWFSLDDLDHDTYFKAEEVGTYTNTLALAGDVITLPFVADVLVPGNFEVLNGTTIIAHGPVSVKGYGPATPRYNPVKLFNYVESELIEEIPLWHPATGQHTPVALESINIISTQNPAKYNVSTLVVNNNSYDPLRPWGSNEIGRVWFDTRNLSYIPYYDAVVFQDRSERLSRWGALADFGSVDVYEWVQSSVPPTEYNALALAQAGDADLDPSTKAGGEVSLQETYVRARDWSIRSVAWSFASVPTADAHPSFHSSFNSKLLGLGFEASGLVSLELGTFEDFGITAGMRIGAWDGTLDTPKPLSEYIIEDKFSKVILGGTNVQVPTTVGTYPASSISITSVKHTSVVGELSITGENIVTRRSDTDGLFIDEYDVSTFIKVTSASGESDVVLVNQTVGTLLSDPVRGGTATFKAGDLILVDVPLFGLQISVTVNATGTFPADALQKAIVEALGDTVYLQDAVQVTAIVPTNVDDVLVPEILSNDPEDMEYITNEGIGWRAWTVPTQAQLDADGRQPQASWKPYVGDFQRTTGSLAQVQDAVQYAKSPLTLNNGVQIQKYSTAWAEWSVLKDTVYTKTQTVTGALSIEHTEPVDELITSVYLNGITQLKASFEISGKVLTLKNVPKGSTSTVIIRKYEPSVEELSFDPTVSDDLTRQLQFKKDYEYVSLPVRDSEGSISSTLYYFWVKNKSSAAASKKLSVQAISQALQAGPAQFLTFQNLLTPTGALPYRYDALTISGLSYIVSKDDTFKLRFTRNFTLRDDPQDLDLKDTHTEWSLIRPGQRTKIPEALWVKLTDSAAGLDTAGNDVPSLKRVLYDERNGSRSQFGFKDGQTLAPRNLLVSSILQAIVNTKLINKNVPASSDGVYPSDFIEFLDFGLSDTWFETPQSTRKIMTDIWNFAKVNQINDIFFVCLNDILASNYELTDLFKTSRLSAYSIKVIPTSPVKPVYE